MKINPTWIKKVKINYIKKRFTLRKLHVKIKKIKKVYDVRSCLKSSYTDLRSTDLMQRKGNPGALLMEMQIGRANIENSMEVCQKIKNTTTTLFSNSTCGYIFKEIKLLCQRGIYNSQDMDMT